MRATPRLMVLVAALLALVPGSLAAAAVTIQPPPAEPGSGLLFHASFDRDRRAEFACGNDLPVMATYARQNRTAAGGTHVDGVFGKALSGSCGRAGAGDFDALGNILAERGTVAFHIRQQGMVYGFEPFMLNTVDPYYWEMYLRICYKGARDLSAWFPNEVYKPALTPARDTTLDEGRWRHLAVVWDQAFGARFYVDGREVGSTWGQSAWTSRGVDPDRLTLHHADGVAYDELYVFDRPLTAAQIRALATQNRTPGAAELPPLEFTEEHRQNRRRELSWLDPDPGMCMIDVTVTGPGANALRQVVPTEARSVRKDCGPAFDGKLGNGWPPLYNYGFANGNGLHVLVEEPYDLVQIEGYFSGAVYGRQQLLAAGEPLATIRSPQFMHRWALDAPRAPGWLSFFKQEMEDPGALPDKELVTVSRICEIGFFRRNSGDLDGAAVRRCYLGPADLESGQTLLGVELSGRFLPGDRATFRLADTVPGAPGGQHLPGLRYHHLLVPPAAEVLALRGLRLALWVQGDLAENALRLELHDPMLPGRRLFGSDFGFRGAAGPGPHPVEVSLDVADRLVPAGKTLWLTLCFKGDVDLLWLGGEKNSRLELLTGTSAQILPEYLRTELAFMKHRFRELSESRPWGAHNEPEVDMPVFNRFARELFVPLTQLRQFLPDDPKVRSIWAFTHKQMEDTSPLTPQPVPGCETAPRWALLQRELHQRCRGVLDWWVEHRQAPNGEFGDDWGDDTDLCQEFPKMVLLGDPDGRLRAAVARVAEGLVQDGRLKRGINARTMDTLHAYEEGLNCQMAMAMINYGDPRYLERQMEATRTVKESLTAYDAKGRRRFRSGDFGADEVRDQGRYGVDHPSNALFLHPALFLAYQSRNPQALGLVQEWVDGWLDYYATAQPPQPGSPYPNRTLMDGTILGWDSKVRGYGYVDSYAALHQLTGAARYLEATKFWTGAGGPGGSFMRGDNYLAALDLLDRVRWRDHLVRWAEEAKLQFVASDELGPAARERYMKYEISGDEGAAYEALEACLRKIRLTFAAQTWGEPINDRIWPPDQPLVMMALGESPYVRNQTWPRHYVSYTAFPEVAAFSDFAAWVREKSDTALRLWIYSFATRMETGLLRVWRTPLGEYEVRFGPDADGDGHPDEARPTRLTLHRSAAIPLQLPARQLCALDLRLVQPSAEDFWKRPDLGISTQDVVWTGPTTLAVTVHNLGGGPAKEVTVCLLDETSGRTLAKKQVPSLDAPLDLLPRTATVEFTGVVPAAGTRLSVSIDPGQAIPELDELNNAVWAPRPE